jgi:hypothetical protein
LKDFFTDFNAASQSILTVDQEAALEDVEKGSKSMFFQFQDRFRLLDLFNGSGHKAVFASANRACPKRKQQTGCHEDDGEISCKFLQHFGRRCPEDGIAGISPKRCTQPKALTLLDEDDKAQKRAKPEKQEQS